MPIYEYKCTGCGEQFEVVQKMADPPLTGCSLCGGELRRLITNTSFVLKGSGWYVTDYPSKERKKAMESHRSADTEKDAQSRKTSESKRDEVAKT